MLTLAHHPPDPAGFVPIVVKVTLRTGAEFYLCNAFAHVQEAIAAGEPFTAHEVVGLRPKPIVLNPTHIAAVRDVA